MIAFLEGVLDSVADGAALLNIGGVGYRVEISSQTRESLPVAGAPVRLHIHHHITESDQRLFGFFSSSEKQLFEQLITVKGVGPKLALTILSGLNPSLLVSAIADQDIAALSRVPGIGKKSAERIVLELKDKIFQPATSGTGEKRAEGTAGTGEALSALEALGFKKRDAERIVMEIVREQEDISVSEIVKLALRRQTS